MKKTLISLICILWASLTFAQCEDALLNAINLYDAGQIGKSIDILEPCVGTISDKDQRFEAYKLLAIAYQYIGSPEESEEYMVLMLMERPDFLEHPNNDPIEFNEEIHKFRVEPKIELGLSFGPISTGVKVKQSYSANFENQSYSRTGGYYVAAVGHYSLWEGLLAKMSLGFINTSINHNIEDGEIWSQRYNERLNFLDFGFGIAKGYFLTKSLSFYPEINFGSSIMVLSKSYVEKTNPYRVEIDQETSNSLEYRNRFQIFGGLSAGLIYGLDNVSVGVQLAHRVYSRTTVDQDARYENTDFMFNSLYVPDDVKLRMTSFSLSLFYPIRYSIYKVDQS